VTGMMKDILVLITYAFTTLCQILLTKDLLLPSMIMLSLLWHFWWLALLFIGIGLLKRSWWMLSNPDAVWLEEVALDLGRKSQRTVEWEQWRFERAIGFAVLGAIALMMSVVIVVNCAS